MDKKSFKKMGPAVITESGEYDSIKSMGPMSISAPAITANSLSAMGPATIQSSTVEVDEMKIQGPLTGSGSLKIANLKINGPVKFTGDIMLSDSGKINGPINLEGSLTGNSEVDLKINGPLGVDSVKDFNGVKVNGPVEADSLTNITTLKINGKVTTEEISVSEDLIISLNSGESVIGKITGNRIEIGQNTENSFFGKFFLKINNPGFATIDEIHSDGTVELDHVKVKKVVARELFAGDETEIGEYIEIQD